MYCIEMLIVGGAWSSEFRRNERGRRYGRPAVKWTPALTGSWVVLAGTFATAEEADARVAQYALTGSWKKPKEFRVLLV